MKLFDTLKGVKETPKKLSTQDAQNRLYEAISEHTGWKLLKSQRCLKKTVGDLVFEIDFFSSKWNVPFERIEVNGGFSIFCKKFDKALNINSLVGHSSIKPQNGEWYDISDEKKLSLATEQICHRLNEDILPLCKSFEKDFANTIKLLAEEENFIKYNIRLQFLDAYAGRNYIIKLAQKYMDTLSDGIKQDIERYKRGDRSKAWMINPSNLKYIIDNDILGNT